MGGGHGTTMALGYAWFDSYDNVGYVLTLHIFPPYSLPYKCMGWMIPIQSSTRSIEERRPIAAHNLSGRRTRFTVHCTLTDHDSYRHTRSMHETWLIYDLLSRCTAVDNTTSKPCATAVVNWNKLEITCITTSTACILDIHR